MISKKINSIDVDISITKQDIERLLELAKNLSELLNVISIKLDKIVLKIK